MAAQAGSAILLQYGIAGVQQPGGAILLSYDQGAEATTVSIRAQVSGKWSPAATEKTATLSPYAAVKHEDQHKQAPWLVGNLSRDERQTFWPVGVKADGEQAAPWGQFGDMRRDENDFAWVKSQATDDAKHAAWGQYGDMLNEEKWSDWFGSKPVDAGLLGNWRGYWITTTVPLSPFSPPLPTAVHFLVSVAGSPLSAQLPGGLADQGLPLQVRFPAAPYTAHYFGNALWLHTPPPATQIRFTTGKSFATGLLVDTLGNPILLPSNRDPYRLNPWGDSKPKNHERRLPWTKYSRPLNPGWGVITPGGPTEPQPGETITIPIQRVYIVVNEILLLRADDDTPIPSTSLSIAFDCDSWLPTFWANIPESARDAVMPDPNPVEIIAYINGAEFRFFVEKVQRNRKFAQRTVSISGRGIACELDAPFAVASQHTNLAAMTAQQLIDAALTNTGYTQAWNITDWLVPADAFSLYGTPAAVAGNVAEASGSVLAADWSLRTLKMKPRYPVKPWDWAAATPEYVIPSAVTQTESIEWIEKPAYNVVYVSGVQQGIVGQIKITGTAGDLPAPMVTHPLITHDDAARQRGISILGDTGRKAMMQISMPVLPATGVIDTCRLIEFTDGANTRRGIVRANNVAVNWPTVRQTLTIEAAA